MKIKIHIRLLFSNYLNSLINLNNVKNNNENENTLINVFLFS